MRDSTDTRSLNIGSGQDENGDVRLDIVSLPHVDVLGDMHNLPFADDSFDVVRLDHVLEHATDVITVLEEIHRVCRADALVHIRVPHGFSVRGIRDPTHRQYFSLRSIEHLCRDQPYLPGWYSDAEFTLETGEVIAGPPNDIGPSSYTSTGLSKAGHLLNKVITSAVNYDPEIFEPLVSLTSRTNIAWDLRVVKE